MTSGTEIALLTGVVFFVAATIWLGWRSPASLLGLHVGSRVLMDSFPALTYARGIGGWSLARWYSIGMVVLLAGVLLTRGMPRQRAYGREVAMLVLAALAATVLGGTWSGFAETSVKWLYMWLTAMLVVAALDAAGEKRVLLVLWLCLLYPVANQAYLGMTVGPRLFDSQPSYSGSYFHESMLAYLILALISVALALTVSGVATIGRVVVAGSAVLGHVALYFNNYRTSFVALAAMWVVLAWWSFPRLKIPGRIAALWGGAIVIAAVVILVGSEVRERFNDVGTLAQDPGKYLDFSGTAKGRDLLSGRVYLWNTYVHKFLSAPWEKMVVGFGPEAGAEMMGVHAHNQIFTTLVDGGMVGLGVLAWAVGYIGVKGARAAKNGSASARTLAAMGLGILVMGLGTSPLRDTRAVLLLGIVVGYLAWVGGARAGPVSVGATEVARRR